MSTLPLEVHEVLEDEYRTTYDEEPPVPVPYDKFELLDSFWACGLLAKCGVTGVSPGDDQAIIAALKSLVAGDDMKGLASSPAITTAGLELINNYAKYEGGKERLNRRIIDEAFRGAVKPLRDMRLEALYAKLHLKPNDEAPTALCISGGGIRSATFALGVIQGLASAKILDKFRYLSTVSGGGYIGSWLSSWARRHPQGMSGVQNDLWIADNSVAGHPSPKTKFEPEPAPLRQLREYSNYLSPRMGITSGDTWTMAALYVRNLLLNLLILIPILAALLAIPRVFSHLVQKTNWATPLTPLWWMNFCLAIGFAYIGLARPVKQGRKDELTRVSSSGLYIIITIVPLAGAAMFLAAYWAQHAATLGMVPGDATFRIGWPALGYALIGVTTWPYVRTALLLMTLLPCAIYYVRYILASAAARRAGVSRQGWAHFMEKLLTEAIAAVVAVGTALGLATLAAIKIFPDPLHPIVDPSQTPPFQRPLTDFLGNGHLFLCFGVPIVLLIFFAQASVFVGISSRVNEDDDREWWGRAGAYLLFYAALIALLGLIAIFGPIMLYRAPVIVASFGGASAVIGALLGFSAKTPANNKQKADAGTTAKVMNAAGGLVVPIFVCILLAAISLGTTWLVEQFNDQKINDTKVSFSSQFQSQASTTEEIVQDGRRYLVKRETEKFPENSFVNARTIAHLKTIESIGRTQVLIIVCVALAALLLSLFIGANKFSMHALYRNRLIRAYLGASRYNRDPDSFTGFDEHDNLQMYELHPDLVWSTTFGSEVAFAKQLVTARGNSTKGSEGAAVAEEIWKLLPFTTRAALERKTKFGTSELRNELLLAINTVLLDVDLGVKAPNALSRVGGHGRVRRNRAIIDSFFPLGGGPTPMPLHVVNTALNLTSGEKLAWQERQAASFTISPLHSGSLYVGYRWSRLYGGRDGVSIGTAVTISGAAASPNQGYHSSPAMAFLLTLLNVRLGWWLGNPGVAGRRTFKKGNPLSSILLLFNELIGNTSDAYPWVYLSDGGHFENLGLYEMVLRRCRYIVVSDAGCDPTFNFEDLGNAMRKIRTDLGVPIDFPRGEFSPRNADGSLRKGRYVVVAPIRYSAVDGEGVPDGKLVYIKPGLYDSDYFPKDVYNYAASSPTFPHETTADQFFSESQFESYRALGRHAINEICGNYGNDVPHATPYTSVADFVSKVVPPSETAPTPEVLIGQHLDKLTAAVADATKRLPWLRPNAAK